MSKRIPSQSAIPGVSSKQWKRIISSLSDDECSWLVSGTGPENLFSSIRDKFLAVIVSHRDTLRIHTSVAQEIQRRSTPQPFHSDFQGSQGLLPLRPPVPVHGSIGFPTFPNLQYHPQLNQYSTSMFSREPLDAVGPGWTARLVGVETNPGPLCQGPKDLSYTPLGSSSSHSSPVNEDPIKLVVALIRSLFKSRRKRKYRSGANQPLITLSSKNSAMDLIPTAPEGCPPDTLQVPIEIGQDIIPSPPYAFIESQSDESRGSHY